MNHSHCVNGFLFYFENMNWVLINGKINSASDPQLMYDNHGYRYGDGLFETMKVIQGNIQLESYHFERLKTGMETLKFRTPHFFTLEKIKNEVTQLCLKNKCNSLARVRLSVSRGGGGLYDSDDRFQYLIECQPLNKTMNQLNENGLIIGIFPDARKAIDKFSNLKSANYLSYVMAALWAKKNKLNDALLLNSHDRICDATIANVFWIKNGIVFTPPLSEGCVAGVMRKYMINEMTAKEFIVQEKELSPEKLEKADEVFLTNSVSEMRWAGQFRNSIYTNKISKKIFEQFIMPMHS